MCWFGVEVFLFGYVGLVGDGGLSFGGFCSVVGVLCVSMLGLVSGFGFWFVCCFWPFLLVCC